jgi:hypothetical protein
MAKWAGLPGTDVVAGDEDAVDGAEGATVVVAAGNGVGVTVLPPPLEHPPSATAPSTLTTTRNLQRPPGMARA